MVDSKVKIGKSINFPLKEIGGIRFLEEDKKGNFYIKTTRQDYGNNKPLHEVHKFSSDGTYLATLLIPETDYSVWAIRVFSLDEDGNIYQFIPNKDKATVNIYGSFVKKLKWG